MNRTPLILLFTLFSQLSLIAISSGEPTNIEVKLEEQSEWIYFPGRKEPVGFPQGVSIEEKYEAPKGDVAVFLLKVEHGQGGGWFYFSTLVCWKDNKTWQVGHRLSSADFRVKLGRRAWIEKVYDATNPREATILMARMENRIGSSKVLRTWEVWDLIGEKFVRKIGPGGPHQQSPDDAKKKKSSRVRFIPKPVE